MEQSIQFTGTVNIPATLEAHVHHAPRALAEPWGGSQETWFLSHLNL